MTCPGCPRLHFPLNPAKIRLNMQPGMHHKGLAGRITSFLDREEIRTPLLRLQQLLPENARIYIVGGALRDQIIREFFGRGPVTEDIDIFIGNLADDFQLKGGAALGRCQTTELGGIRWLPDSTRYAFDLSRLQDFVIFKKYGIQPSLQNLLSAVDFTFNAIAYDRKSALLHQTCSLQAIAQRLLDFNSKWILSRKVIAYRALLLRFKTGFILSEAVFDFLKTNVDVEVLTFVKNLLQTRLPPDTVKAVLDDYRRISGFKDYEQYRLGAMNAAQKISNSDR